MIIDQLESSPQTVPPYACDTCGFDLWSPIADVSQVSQLALYDDNRFPGRCLLAIRGHHEHFDQLPSELAAAFMKDVARSMTAIQKATGATRINIAILGNAVPHIHAHLIPRYPGNEDFPHDTPWKDPRPEEPLDAQLKATMVETLRAALA